MVKSSGGRVGGGYGSAYGASGETLSDSSTTPPQLTEAELERARTAKVIVALINYGHRGADIPSPAAQLYDAMSEAQRHRAVHRVEAALGGFSDISPEDRRGISYRLETLLPEAIAVALEANDSQTPPHE